MSETDDRTVTELPDDVRAAAQDAADGKSRCRRPAAVAVRLLGLRSGATVWDTRLDSDAVPPCAFDVLGTWVVYPKVPLAAAIVPFY